MAHPNPSGRPANLAGLCIVSFESSRARDLTALLHRAGAEVHCAPSMREVPLADEKSILEFGMRLFEGECDALVLLTGVGTTILVDALSTRWPRASVLSQLGRVPLLCRGPKTAAVLSRLGLSPELIAPEPNGPRELLGAIDREFDVRGKRVFVQEYGAIDAELLEGLRRRGARLAPVEIYRWALPEDTRELRLGLQRIAQRRADAVVFTSTHQVENVFEYADRVQLGGPLRQALRSWALVLALGPVTRDALARHRVEADLIPDEPKRAALVQAFARSAALLLRAKRGPRREGAE